MYVPKNPRELGFNLDSWRPFQRPTINRLVSGSPDLVQLVCAPTGSGKSPIAAGAALVLAGEGKKSTILTHQKALQEQYMSYGLPVTTATGRGNHDCILDVDWVPAGLRADKAPCVSGYRCEHAIPEDELNLLSVDCPYYLQRNRAAISPVRILNYAYFFLTTKHFRSDALFCDEGHRLDKALLDSQAVRLSPSNLRRLHDWGTPLPDIEHGKQLANLEDFPGWVTSAIIAGNTAKKDAKDQDDLFAIRMLMYDLLQLLALSSRTTVVVNGTQFLPVLPEEHAQSVLLSGLNEGGRLVIMSASLFDPEYIMHRLGLSTDRLQFTELPSRFAVDRRPVYYRPTVQANVETMKDPAMLRILTDEIDLIIEQYGTQKGVIHCASFQLGREIALRSRYRGRMVLAEPGATHVEEFTTSRHGVYVSPSAYEGYDFKHDLCRFNIIAKLSWPNRGDPVTALQIAKIKGFNEYETGSALVQGAGRGTRDEDDWCDSFILDRSFEVLWRKSADSLPRYFTQAVRFP